MDLDYDGLQADGAQEANPHLAGEFLARCGITRIGRYDFERAAPGHLFHEECGYLWILHDTTVKGRPLPFGCPSETEARQAWGRD